MKQETKDTLFGCVLLLALLLVIALVAVEAWVKIHYIIKFW